MKKFNKFLAVILSLVLCLILGACNKEPDKKPSDDIPDEPVKQTIVLEKDKINLKIGDSYKIKATFIPVEGENLKFVLKEDNGVCSVSEDGVVTGQNVGAAIVVVSYFNANPIEFNVIVGIDNIVPKLDFTNINKNTITINVNDKVNINTEVNFNGNIYDDHEVVYTVSVADVGTIDDKAHVFTATKKGEVVITATAKWHGIENINLVKTIKIIIE